MRTYHDLVVWQRADDVAMAVYEITRDFPVDERFGLTSQMRRAAVSVASNIVEAAGRASRRDGARLLSIAAGSAWELGYQLDLARRLGYTNEATAALTGQIEGIKKMLRSLHRQWLR